MSVSSIYNTSTTSNSSSSSEKNEAEKLQNQFLQILLTQLQTQTPTDPVDTAEFTSQLTQYSQLEQQLSMNTKLDSLLAAVSASAISPFSFLGQNVTVESNTTVAQDGKISWQYDVPADAKDVTITVKDTNGKVVYTGSGNPVAGLHDINVDVADAADGTQYTVTVSATDSTGADISKDVAVTTQMLVDAVDSSSGTLMLESYGFQFESGLVSRVATVKKPSTTA
jgi:flagellar basal-body rod modification protein FlgD